MVYTHGRGLFESANMSFVSSRKVTMRYDILHRKPNEDIGTLSTHAILHENAVLADNGALCVVTGKRTGRSPKVKRVIDHPSIRNKINWNQYNIPYDPDLFELGWRIALHRANAGSPLFYSNDLWGGTHPQYRIPLEAYTEYAWHQQFIRTVVPKDAAAPHDESKTWTLLNLPSFEAPKALKMEEEAGIWIDYVGKRILALGLRYGGENKKAFFCVENYELPLLGVLTMHCSVVVTDNGKVVWMFGLSGTGKTTHATSDRFLMVGDDMFAYSPDGITSQLEDGCYPSIIKLSAKNEPGIYKAVNRFGSILENVVLHDGTPDFNDGKFTQNTRGAYPLSHIARRTEKVLVGKPDYIIFLTCDAHGVLPPLGLLPTKEAAIYHYLSGYTSKVGRTLASAGKAIEPTFSSYFGEDFYPLRPDIYVDLFTKMLEDAKPKVALVNTGYTGGSAEDGTGLRFDIPSSRAAINAFVEALDGKDGYANLPEFNLIIPRRVDGLSDEERNPTFAWKGREDEYEKRTKVLADAFSKNWDKKFPALAKELRDAGLPRN